MLILVTGASPKLWITTRLQFRKLIVISGQDLFCIFLSHLSHSVPGCYLEATDLVSFALFTSCGHTDDKLDCFRLSIPWSQRLSLFCDANRFYYFCYRHEAVRALKASGRDR